MFEFLFKYPGAVFTKGKLVLLSGWPTWVLLASVVILAGLVAWRIHRALPYRNGSRGRAAAVWVLQTVFLALLLLLLWRPAVSVASLKPQENIIAVLVDDSRSMALKEDGKTRLERTRALLDSGLLASIRDKFQVRMYRFGGELERIEKSGELTAREPASRINEALRRVAAEASSVPIGAVVLLSDGADNSGGVDLDTIGQVRRRRIPVHTIGFGREKPANDLEIAEATLPARALAGSRLAASVTLRHSGFNGQKVRVSVRDEGKVLMLREIALRGNGAEQTESLQFSAGQAGARGLDISVDKIEGEENTANNHVTRLVQVDAAKPRVLYLEGEPRWELKFMRRALEDDGAVKLVTLLRTTQNKIYRQGVEGKDELEQGFPSKAEELFSYQGLILGSVEAAYLTPGQQELIREFVDRRGGGLLFLGGRASLAEGGYARPPFAELLPVELPGRRGTFHRENVTVGLTTAGRDSIICRLLEDPESNADRWRKLPPLADYQEIGDPKPGAVMLAELRAGSRTLPLLVTENYGRGRTAVFATGGSWRWQMMQELADQTHEMFWRQMLRWLVWGAPGQVALAPSKSVLNDEGRVTLRAEARDKAFRAVPNARVEAKIMGPDGSAETIELRPKPQEDGVYTADWNAEKPGSYVAEIVARDGEQEIGRDAATFRREDGVAENFRSEQNRELLEKLASQTGGRYYRPADASKLVREIEYSEAGVTIRETRDLWDMPVVFLIALMLRSAEWLLRRKWGVV